MTLALHALHSDRSPSGEGTDVSGTLEGLSWGLPGGYSHDAVAPDLMSLRQAVTLLRRR
jgi:hypothetical protein